MVIATLLSITFISDLKRSKRIPHILVETEEERKERLKYSKTMTTKVVPNKKKNSRAEQKHYDRKSMGEDIDGR